MKRKDFYKLLSPLIDKLYTLAFSLLPDDLQAEQLVIDSVNAYLFKEKKWINSKEIELENKKEVTLVRKMIFKSLLKYFSEIGFRRSAQMPELSRSIELNAFTEFFSLEPKARLIVRLRFEMQFSVDDIADILELPRYDVIEKIHNSRFLLLHQRDNGVEA
jgi:hypothetical protein